MRGKFFCIEEASPSPSKGGVLEDSTDMELFSNEVAKVLDFGILIKKSPARWWRDSKQLVLGKQLKES